MPSAPGKAVQTLRNVGLNNLVGDYLIHSKLTSFSEPVVQENEIHRDTEIYWEGQERRKMNGNEDWSGREDSNLRPPGPELWGPSIQACSRILVLFV
jgi:hypothetical protein